MNAWHQHFNVSGAEAARYVAMTSAPRVIDTFDDYEFVFENPFVFKSRFKAEEGYFKEAERKTDAPLGDQLCRRRDGLPNE